MADDRVDRAGGQEDARRILVHEQPDVRDDEPAVAPRRARDLAAVADHRGAVRIQIAAPIGGGEIEDRDIDRRQPVAEPLTLGADHCSRRPPCTGEPRPTRGSRKVPTPTSESTVSPPRPSASKSSAITPSGRHWELAAARRGHFEEGAKGLEVAGEQARHEARPRQLVERPGEQPASAVAADVHECQPARMSGRLEALAQCPVQDRGALVSTEARDGDDGAIPNPRHGVARARELRIPRHPRRNAGVVTRGRDDPARHAQQQHRLVDDPHVRENTSAPP